MVWVIIEVLLGTLDGNQVGGTVETSDQLLDMMLGLKNVTVEGTFFCYLSS